MKIIENKYEDKLFPRIETCQCCGSVLELERKDCKSWWDDAFKKNIYEFICPCCVGKSSFFSEN